MTRGGGASWLLCRDWASSKPRPLLREASIPDTTKEKRRRRCSFFCGPDADGRCLHGSNRQRDERQRLPLSCRAKSSHRRPPVARRSTSCAVLAVGHWQVSRCFLKGEVGFSHLGSTGGWGGGVHRSAKRKSTVAPPPAPLHPNPTRSHPSGRHRCHGAFVAARQVAQIKDPKICSAGGGRGFDTSLKHLLITDWPPSCLLRCLAVGAVMVAAWSQQARAQPAASRQQRRRSFNFLPRMWSHRG